MRASATLHLGSIIIHTHCTQSYSSHCERHLHVKHLVGGFFCLSLLVADCLPFDELSGSFASCSSYNNTQSSISTIYNMCTIQGMVIGESEVKQIKGFFINDGV